MTFDYDLFVIGGGSGGVRGAHRGQRIRRPCGSGRGIAHGRHLRHPAARAQKADDLRLAGAPWPRNRAMAGPRPAPANLTGLPSTASSGANWTGLRASYRRSGWARAEIHHQRARVVDAHTVELASGARITAKHILIAAGGRPQLPGIPGEEAGDDLGRSFTMKALPGSVLVVGGGFIACEFATILNLGENHAGLSRRQGAARLLTARCAATSPNSFASSASSCGWASARCGWSARASARGWHPCQLRRRQQRRL